MVRKKTKKNGNDIWFENLIKNNRVKFNKFFGNFVWFINKNTGNFIEKKIVQKRLGYTPNTKNPKSFNEKILWKKLNKRDSLIGLTSDKFKVRSYVEKILGRKKSKEILIPLLYVTDKPETIPFEKLPKDFIIKANHACGWNIIVRNGKFKKKKIIKKCKNWLNAPYGLERMEWAYKPIKRKIIIEKLITDEKGKIPIDYKFHIFNGKCKLIHIDIDRFGEISQSLFSPDWEYLYVKKERPLGKKIKKPENYEKMLKIAEKLGKEFDFVRVDLYNINGKIYFGELTHYSGSGTTRFHPKSFDYKLGGYWKIRK